MSGLSNASGMVELCHGKGELAKSESKGEKRKAFSNAPHQLGAWPKQVFFSRGNPRNQTNLCIYRNYTNKGTINPSNKKEFESRNRGRQPAQKSSGPQKGD